MMSTTHFYDVRDGIATVTLDQPSKLNPLNRQMQQKLQDAVQRVHDDRSVRAVLLTGSGKAFSAGGDLSTMDDPLPDGKTLGDVQAEQLVALSTPLLVALRDLPVPILAAVNGVVAGAGVGLALAADIVLVARAAYFYLPFVPRLGVLPDFGATWHLPRAVGHARATGMALLGDRVSAEQAVAWGLAWACVDDDALANSARETALRLAALPPGIALELRQAHVASADHDFKGQLLYEAERQRHLIDSGNFKLGVDAFLEKRAPRFKGR